MTVRRLFCRLCGNPGVDVALEGEAGTVELCMDCFVVERTAQESDEGLYRRAIAQPR